MSCVTMVSTVSAVDISSSLFKSGSSSLKTEKNGHMGENQWQNLICMICIGKRHPSVILVLMMTNYWPWWRAERVYFHCWVRVVGQSPLFLVTVLTLWGDINPDLYPIKVWGERGSFIKHDLSFCVTTTSGALHSTHVNFVAALDIWQDKHTTRLPLHFPHKLPTIIIVKDAPYGLTHWLQLTDELLFGPFFLLSPQIDGGCNQHLVIVWVRNVEVMDQYNVRILAGGNNNC